MEEAICSIVEPVIIALGFTPVEIKTRQVKGTLHIHLVLYRGEGISIDDCAEVYRTILPRIEAVTGERDLHLEVSSPGIDRVLKNNSEFAIFIGSTVKVLTKSNDDWYYGRILSADENTVLLSTEEGEEKIAFENIKKAKLQG
jgi:ribosome maturation factor RimP